MTPTVIAVSRDSGHRSSKVPVDVVTLLAGLGVAGDAHAGVTVQHRSRVAADPSQPNLRQVQLERVLTPPQDDYFRRPDRDGEGLSEVNGFVNRGTIIFRDEDQFCRQQ